MANKKKSFKKIGTNILQEKPKSMADYMGDAQMHKCTNGMWA